MADIARFESENRECESKKVKIGEDIVLLQQAIEELQRKKETLSVVLNGESAKKEEMSRRLNALRNGVRGIEDEIIRIKTDMHHQQMRQQEVQFNQRAIKDRLLQTYKIDWDADCGSPAYERDPAKAVTPEGTKPTAEQDLAVTLSRE